MLIDAPWVEANDQHTHTFVRRTKLISGGAVGYNEGVPNSIGKAEQVTEGLMTLAARCEFDERLLRRESNENLIRMQEAVGAIEGLSQTLSKYIKYGNGAIADADYATKTALLLDDGTYIGAVNPKAIKGIVARGDFDGLADDSVRGAGGSGAGAVTSIYMIEWGPDTVHFVYPKGDPGMGLAHVDRGLEKVYSSTTKSFYAKVSTFEAGVGLIIKDPRAIQRLCNITPSSTTTTDSMLGDDNIKQLIDMLAALPTYGGNNPVIYVPRLVWAQMQKNAYDKANGFYPAKDPWGAPAIEFMGVPIRLDEGIITTEEVVS
jgi:hypothetical protein